MHGWPLHNLEKLPDGYQVVANLYDNPWLRRIRQTGSRLIPEDREIRFARARVKEAHEKFEEEQAGLDAMALGNE